MLHLVRLWLSNYGRPKNPVVVQSTRTDVSAVFSVVQNPEYVYSNANEGVDSLGRASRQGGREKEERERD